MQWLPLLLCPCFFCLFSPVSLACCLPPVLFFTVHAVFISRRAIIRKIYINVTATFYYPDARVSLVKLSVWVTPTVLPSSTDLSWDVFIFRKVNHKNFTRRHMTSGEREDLWIPTVNILSPRHFDVRAMVFRTRWTGIIGVVQVLTS